MAGSFGGLGGFRSIHPRLRLPADNQYFDRIHSLPCVFGANGTVHRTSDPGRDRRIVDGKAPRRKRMTLDKKTVVHSVGVSCGWDDSKTIHRASNSRPSWLRHSPAFRKQPMAALLQGPQRRLAASSTTPSQARAMAVADGLSGQALELASARLESRRSRAGFGPACCR
jgi:hypothetical protein